MTIWENSNFRAVGEIGKGLAPSNELSSSRTQRFVAVSTAVVEQVACKKCGAAWDQAAYPSNAALFMQRMLKVRCPACDIGDIVPIAP
jgi:hypothetical protein